MLKQELEAIRAQRRRQYIQLVGFFAIISVCCGVVIFVLPAVFQSESRPDLESVSETVAETSPHPVSLPVDISDPSGVDLRQSFIDALNVYESSVEAELGKVDVQHWQQSKSARLITLKEELLSKFSMADYSSALNQLEVLQKFAEQLLADANQQFNEDLASAHTAYQSDDYESSKFHIERALMLNNRSDEAMALAAKITTLPDILPLLRQAEVARVENHYEKELGVINKIIHLARHRQTAVQRRQQLLQLINNRKFEQYVATFYEAMEQGDLNKASQQLKVAKEIYPKRQEIADLNDALQVFKQQQLLKQHHQAARHAIAADDWQQAQQQLKQVLSLQHDDKWVQDNMMVAEQIIRLKAQLDELIENPYRLTNEAMVKKARDRVNTSRNFTKLSPSLHKKAKRLDDLIARLNKRVAVGVISDNQTEIIVRGVGVVGRTLSKTIRLPPGRYRFEGKRKGFKSELLDVLIPYDQDSYSLTVICDERI